MDALIELCDLVAENPAQFSEKLAWICNRCPSSEFFLSGSPRVSRSQLNAVLATARFVSKCPHHDDPRARVTVLEFLRSIPLSFSPSFWPQSFGNTSIASFYEDFLDYICKAAELLPEFCTDTAGFTGEVVFPAVIDGSGDLGISRAFLKALSQSFPPILPSDANRLISSLVDRLDISVPCLPKEVSPGTPDATSSQSSPLIVNHYQPNVSNASGLSSGEVSKVGDDATSSSSKGLVANGGSLTWKSNMDVLGSSGTGFADGGGAIHGRMVASFEEESIENLEKQEVSFKLITHILDKVQIDPKLVDQVRMIAKEELQSLLTFLKMRKRDWTEQGSLLKARINTKLSVYQAAARLKIISIKSLDLDGKSSKKLLHGTLALLIEAAEACLYSVWRKLRICEDLFDSLLGGISHIAVTRGGQLLRVLLIRFKRLVLTACAQAETSESSRVAMFESVLKTSCEIVEFGWSKDRSPVDTFIMGLATSIRDRNDYEEEIYKAIIQRS